MKKALYGLLAVVLVGGVSFALSQSSLLKGNLGGLDEGGPDTGTDIGTVETPDGGGGGVGGGFEPGGFGTDDDDPSFPGGEIDLPGPGVPAPGGGNDCDAEYYIDVYAQTVDGVDLTALNSSHITVFDGSGDNVDAQFSFDNSRASNGNYRLDYTGSGTPDDEYEVEVDPNGYKSTSIEAFINSTCSDLRSSVSATLSYNHTISVKDHLGNNVSTADVNTGNDFNHDCKYWSSGQKYLCATPDTAEEQYKVNVTGYVSKEGRFGVTTQNTPQTPTNFGMASLLAAVTGVDFSTSSSGIDLSETVGSGLSTSLSTHKTVTMSEFAWTVTVTDSETEDPITNADVTFDSGTSLECTHQSAGLYWCKSSYYNSSGKKPTYNVTKSTYESASGSFSTARTELTSAGVNQDIALVAVQTTEPASYCDTLDVSSGDLPIAADATSVGDLDIEVEVIASNAAYEDTIELTLLGSGTLSAYSASVSGLSSTPQFTWSGAEVGDVLTVTSDGCDSATLTVTQETDDEEDEEDEEEEYELACTDADITPDSYEIYLSASSSTLHEFELEWTVVEQLVALQSAPEWIKRSFAYKHSLDPRLQLAEEGDSITFTIQSTGNGDLYYSADLTTGHSELTYEVSSAETDSITFYYSGADGGDSLYVTSSDGECSDSLTLSEEEEEEEDEEDEIDFSTIEDTDECEAYPFTDVDEDDDMATYIYCLAQTGAVQGYGDGSFGPSNRITNAELIKIVVAMTGEPLVSGSADTDFIDIEGHWAERYIKTAESLDIARPRESVRFNPDSPATRGYLVVALARAAEKTLWGWDADDIPFEDVRSTDYFAYAVILAAKAEGDVPGIGDEAILTGYSDDTFRGTNSIQRDEAAAMLIRAFYAWF